MADVTLSAAVRASLLSLQSTTDLIDRTQNRLSTGLKVSGPVDDPVAYFQAKALGDRAFDFTEKKNAIDQGISTVSAALDGVNSIETLVRQLKGVANSMKSASAAQFSDLVTQFNDLRTQVNNLAADSSYQGTNLINGTGQNLTVEFSDLTAARLTLDSVDLTVGTNGLSIGDTQLYTAGAAYFSYAAGTSSANVLASTADGDNNQVANGISQTGSLSLTWEGANATYTAGSTIALTYGTQSLTIQVNDEQTLDGGDVITVNVDSAAGTSGFSIVANDYIDGGVIYSAGTAGNITLTQTLSLTWQGADVTADSSTTYSVTYGTQTVNIQFTSAFGTLAASDTLTLSVISAASDVTAASGGAYVVAGTGLLANTSGLTTSTAAVGLALTATVDANDVTTTYVKSGDTTAVNRAITELDAALTTLRSKASSLGSNVATLQTRLDFTKTYVNTLSEGSSKLTLADLNEEGANLLALQTRQQLGIQSLSFAGQAEQSILGLFR